MRRLLSSTANYTRFALLELEGTNTMASRLEVKKNPPTNMLNMLFSTKKSYEIPVEKDIFASDSEEEEKTSEIAAIPLKLSFGSENDSSIQSNKVQSDMSQPNQSGDVSALSDKGNSMDEITKGLETCLLEEYENNNETDEEVEKSYLGRHEVTILHSSESDLCDTNKKVMEEIELKCMEIPKKPIRKRIIMMSSTDSESEKEPENENDCNASFDIGAIKRKFARTPAARVASRSSISDKNDYDFEDSFINDNEDQSESDFTNDEEVCSFSSTFAKISWIYSHLFRYICYSYSHVSNIRGGWNEREGWNFMEN